jgi:hypothetical protein
LVPAPQCRSLILNLTAREYRRKETQYLNWPLINHRHRSKGAEI